MLLQQRLFSHSQYLPSKVAEDASEFSKISALDLLRIHSGFLRETGGPRSHGPTHLHSVPTRRSSDLFSHSQYLPSKVAEDASEFSKISAVDLLRAHFSISSAR